jgi:hypothetical protein
MCSKHDDPSMYDMPRQVNEEEAHAMKLYRENFTIELHTSEADEYMRYIGDGCDYDCWTREMLTHPFEISYIHNWNNHKNLWREQSEKYAEALYGANQMRSLAYAKVVEPEGWWEESGINNPWINMTFEEAVEYYR